MVSFIILIKFVNGAINSELRKVMNIDIVGIIVLIIGFVIFKFKSNYYIYCLVPKIQINQSNPNRKPSIAYV